MSLLLLLFAALKLLVVVLYYSVISSFQPHSFPNQPSSGGEACSLSKSTFYLSPAPVESVKGGGFNAAYEEDDVDWNVSTQSLNVEGLERGGRREKGLFGKLWKAKKHS